MAKECEKSPIGKPDRGPEDSASKDLLCEHKDNRVPYFAIGLCETCYKDFVKLSGGLDGGLDPPAFQHAEKDRMTKSVSEENTNESSDLAKASNGASAKRKEDFHAPKPESIQADMEDVAAEDGGCDGNRNGDSNEKTHDESESLSDIDDGEVIGYLHNEEEKHYKKIIWEKMNREHLEEQAAAAAAYGAFGANFQNCSGDLLAARELAASAAAAVAKSRKEKKQRRSQEAKNSDSAQSAAEATRQMLIRKRLSSKVNFDVLEKLFDESAPQGKPKKVRVVPSEDQNNKEPKTDDKSEDDELGSEGEEGGDTGGTYGSTFYDENMEQTYDFEDDDYGDDGC